MLKRVISMILCLAMVLPMVPVGARAVEEVKGDFLQKIDQITWDDRVPEGYTAIYDEAGLRAIEEDPAGLYILMEDIELENFAQLLSPSNPFTGVLEGNGHTISGITRSHIIKVNKTAQSYYGGLFASIKNARIANLKISGNLELDIQHGSSPFREGSYYMGGLAGEAVGSCNIINCVNNVEVTCKSFNHSIVSVGGLIGYYQSNNGTTNIHQCRNMAQIRGIEDVAGILASATLNAGTLNITHCENNGTILGEAIGQLGTPFIAGIVGNLESTKTSSVRIFACKNTGKLLSQGVAAGILNNTNNMKYGAVTVDSCANTGEIVSEGGSSGIGYAVSAVTTVQDCINMGQVYTQVVDLEKGIEAYGTGTAGGGTGTATYSINCCAGIAVSVNGIVTRCINVGKNTCEGQYRSAIANNIIYKESEVKNHLIDCYWLDDGSTNTLYRYTLSGTVTELKNQGKLTAEQMTKEETFKNFSFPDVWTMDEDLKHPYPTALLELTLDNLYQETYITDTAVFADDSVRYVTILGGSGDGSLAGLVGEKYQDSLHDEVNEFWDGMQFVEGLANYKIDPITDYDVLLADLVAGPVAENIRNEHLTTMTMNFLSELVTLAGAELDAVGVLATEKYLENLARVTSMFSDPAQTLVEGIRETALTKVPYDKLSGAMTKIGGVVNIADAAAAGCENVWDAFQFYVICNAYPNMVESYADLILAAAEQAKKIDTEEGGDLYKSANKVVTEIYDSLNQDPKAVYKATGGSLMNLLSVGGFSICEGMLKLKELNPVLTVVDGIKTGITVGMPVADALTNMDDISYYGRMLAMAGVFSKGLFAEVQKRHNAFAHSQSYEDAQALNTAANMYLNLQILACDYAIGYSNAILSSGLSWTLRGNMDEAAAIIQLQVHKANLLKMQNDAKHIYIGKDGSVNGFVANCPVTVTVTDETGEKLAKLATGDIQVKNGYGASYQLIGMEGEHKAGLYDPTRHTLTVTGEAEGKMDLMLYKQDGDITYTYTYRDIPVEKDCRYEVTEEKITGEKADGTPVEFTPEKDNSEPHVHEYKKSGGASCTEAGTATYACSCGDSYTKEEKALGHNYVDGICSRCKEPEPVSDSDVTRIYGETRFRTAITAAEALKGMLGVDRFNSIILASGTSFADALAGSYLAAVKGAPILLSTAKSDSANLEYIVDNLAPGGTVCILGGTAAVSESIENLLTDVGIPSKRLSGSNRYVTNLLILEEAGFAGGEILVATGQEFADSLSASATGKPILLVSNKWAALSREYVDYLSGKSCSFTIIGGTGAVNVGIERDLGSYGNVARIYGSTRQETAVAVAKRYFGTPDTAFLAYARNFPDGLCGGPLAYAKGAPLLLVNEGKEAAAAGYVAEKGIRKGYVMGGTAVVSDASVKKVFP